MEIDSIRALQRLNNGFYREHHESFSASRSNAWPGWERVGRHLEGGRLLDVACGNLRFERFLDQSKGKGSFEFTCIDSCPDLVKEHEGVSFLDRDVLDCLISGLPLPDGFDAAVSFGFAHHVPSQRLRVEFLRRLIGCVRPDGVVAISFWQFMHDGRLADKARATTKRGCSELGLELDEGDYLLGWNDEPGAYRYCHSFGDGEIDSLVHELSHQAEAVDRFKADGRTGELNGYLVFRRL